MYKLLNGSYFTGGGSTGTGGTFDLLLLSSGLTSALTVGNSQYDLTLTGKNTNINGQSLISIGDSQTEKIILNNTLRVGTEINSSNIYIKSSNISFTPGRILNIFGNIFSNSTNVSLLSKQIDIFADGTGQRTNEYRIRMGSQTSVFPNIEIKSSNVDTTVQSSMRIKNTQSQTNRGGGIFIQSAKRHILSVIDDTTNLDIGSTTYVNNDTVGLIGLFTKNSVGGISIISGYSSTNSVHPGTNSLLMYGTIETNVGLNNSTSTTKINGATVNIEGNDKTWIRGNSNIHTNDTNKIIGILGRTHINAYGSNLTTIGQLQVNALSVSERITVSKGITVNSEGIIVTSGGLTVTGGSTTLYGIQTTSSGSSNTVTIIGNTYINSESQSHIMVIGNNIYTPPTNQASLALRGKNLQINDDGVCKTTIGVGGGEVLISGSGQKFIEGPTEINTDVNATTTIGSAGGGVIIDGNGTKTIRGPTNINDTVNARTTIGSGGGDVEFLGDGQKNIRGEVNINDTVNKPTNIGTGGGSVTIGGGGPITISGNTYINNDGLYNTRIGGLPLFFTEYLNNGSYITANDPIINILKFNISPSYTPNKSFPIRNSSNSHVIFKNINVNGNDLTWRTSIRNGSDNTTIYMSNTAILNSTTKHTKLFFNTITVDTIPSNTPLDLVIETTDVEYQISSFSISEVILNMYYT